MRILVCSLALVCGCVDGEGRSPDPVEEPDPDPDPGTDPPPPAGSAREAFEDFVHPILVSACGACHEGAGGIQFVSKDPVQAYEQAVAFAGLVGDFTHAAPIAHIPNQLHPTVPLAAEQQQHILDWLDLECAERGCP